MGRLLCSAVGSWVYETRAAGRSFAVCAGGDPSRKLVSTVEPSPASYDAPGARVCVRAAVACRRVVSGCVEEDEEAAALGRRGCMAVWRWPVTRGVRGGRDVIWAREACREEATRHAGGREEEILVHVLIAPSQSLSRPRKSILHFSGPFPSRSLVLARTLLDVCFVLREHTRGATAGDIPSPPRLLVGRLASNEEDGRGGCCGASDDHPIIVRPSGLAVGVVALSPAAIQL